MKRPWIAAIIVSTIFIVFRIITVNHPELANFSPIAALVFCGAAFWKSNKWMLPTALVVWLVSSLLLNHMHLGYFFHSATLVTLLGFAAVCSIGFLYAGKSTGKLIFGTLLGATSFYLITNTSAFLTDPVYPKNIEGFIQCMWTGSPVPSHSTPTWTFFRNSLVANGLATSLFLLAMSVPSIRKATQFPSIKQTA